MSKTGRKQKYTTAHLEEELSILIAQRYYLKIQREIEKLEKEYHGEEAILSSQSEEELEINERIAALRSVIYKRKN